MRMKLEDYILDRAKAGQESKRLMQQVQNLLDLTATVPEKAVLGVVGDELAALREELAGALGDGMAARAVAELAGMGGDLRGEAWMASYPEPARAAVARADRSYRDLEYRVGYLMRPTTFEEAQALDPVKDCDRLYHFLSYDFRLEHKFYANLFEARPTVIPTGSLLFHSTGEFTLRSVKRIQDTVLFFSNLMEWGLESYRGRLALKRLNGIHGRYSVSSDTFKFILGNVMFVPELWNAKLGWRPMTRVELEGWYQAFAKVGRAMNIRAIPDDREEMRQWWFDYGARMADSTPVQRKTFDEIVLQVLAIYPKALRRFALNALLTGMDDLYRNALGYPAPPSETVAELREAFRLVGVYTSKLPRIPWFRSLQTYPLGAEIGRLGVSERSVYMPVLEEEAPNRGYPVEQHPLGPEEGAESLFFQLPVISEEELRRHAGIHSAWTAIDGIVYDLTPFLFEHPGGIEALKPWLGKDATSPFRKVGHTPEARALMLNFRIGRLPGAGNRPIPIGETTRTRKRPGWEAQIPASLAEWNALLDGLLAAVEAYEANIALPAVQADGPVAPFPVQLPSHPRPQGVCPFPHGQSGPSKEAQRKASGTGEAQ